MSAVCWRQPGLGGRPEKVIILESWQPDAVEAGRKIVGVLEQNGSVCCRIAGQGFPVQEVCGGFQNIGSACEDFDFEFSRAVGERTYAKEPGSGHYVSIHLSIKTMHFAAAERGVQILFVPWNDFIAGISKVNTGPIRGRRPSMIQTEESATGQEQR